MCGIFAYIGKKNNAAEIVFKGLKTLEYRGYDSWGIAVKSDNKIATEKHVGKININTTRLPNSFIGIGHTRWATHGGATETNAHPHLDCNEQISVLHNGIVENYQELKNKLLKQGHIFASETDTEVIAHLLEELIKKETFTNAVKKAFGYLEGLNAIVAINTSSHEIIAAKNGSPLVVGLGDNEFFLASDAAGIIPYTNKVIFLKDNELISLNTNYKLYSLITKNEITPEIETIDWNITQASKGSFEHYMIKEIHEQPIIVNMIADTYTDQIIKLSQIIKKSKETFFIGCGTAYHACLAGLYLFSKIAKQQVITAPASEFNYLENFISKNSLIIPLSQSGETIDIIEPLNHFKKKGSKILSLTNTLGSTIYRMGDYKLLLGAGPEKAVASTKAYLAKICVLTLLAYALDNKLNEGKKILKASANEIKKTLNKDSQKQIIRIANILSKKEHIYIIGRGNSFTTALEGALKIKEVSYIHTDGLAGGELKHGTIALIDEGTPCIVIAPQDETYNSIISNAIEIKSRGGYIIGISSKNNPAFNEWIKIRETGSSLLTHIIPMQLLAYYIALIKNLDPDKPRNLAKSVTVK